jgi:hypothetical protein
MASQEKKGLSLFLVPRRFPRFFEASKRALENITTACRTNGFLEMLKADKGLSLFLRVLRAGFAGLFLGVPDR